MNPIPTRVPLLARLFGRRKTAGDRHMVIHLIEWRGRYYPVGTSVAKEHPAPKGGWAAEFYSKP